MADLSKIKLGTTTYNLKDAQARADITTLLGSHNLAALGDAAWKGVVASIGSGMTEGDLTTGKAVKDYVESMIETIPEFDVIVVPEGQNLPTASADTFHKIYLQAASSPASPNLYIEWITVRSGNEGSYTYSWEKIGDTAMDLSGYVQKIQKIAGIDLQDDITVAELQAALDLGNMAYANTATGEVAGQTINGVAVTGTLNAGLTGELNVASTAAELTKADYTPAGSITGSAISDGSIEVTLKDAATASSASITAESYTPAGEVSKPSITVTPTDDTIQPVSNVGTAASLGEGFFTAGSAASFTEGTFTPASLTHAESAFAVEGMVAAIDGTDAEQLNLTNATTANASLISAFSGGSKAADSFTANTPAAVDITKFNGGSVPTLGTAKTFLTGASAALDAAPTFTGTAAADMKVTKVEYNKQVVDEASFSGVAATLGFSGTKQTGALVTGVNYDKTTLGTLGAEASVNSLTTADISVAAKNVTVSPDAKNNG